MYIKAAIGRHPLHPMLIADLQHQARRLGMTPVPPLPGPHDPPVDPWPEPKPVPPIRPPDPWPEPGPGPEPRPMPSSP